MGLLDFIKGSKDDSSTPSSSGGPVQQSGTPITSGSYASQSSQTFDPAMISGGAPLAPLQPVANTSGMGMQPVSNLETNPQFQRGTMPQPGLPNQAIFPAQESLNNSASFDPLDMTSGVQEPTQPMVAQDAEVANIQDTVPDDLLGFQTNVSPAPEQTITDSQKQDVVANESVDNLDKNLGGTGNPFLDDYMSGKSNSAASEVIQPVAVEEPQVVNQPLSNMPKAQEIPAEQTTMAQQSAEANNSVPAVNSTPAPEIKIPDINFDFSKLQLPGGPSTMQPVPKAEEQQQQNTQFENSLVNQVEPTSQPTQTTSVETAPMEPTKIESSTAQVPVVEEVTPEPVIQQQPEIAPSTESVTPTVETKSTTQNYEPRPVKVETAPKTNKKDYFRKIALVGLSGPKFDPNHGLAVKDLVKKLYKSHMEVILDSKEGLGEFAIQAVNEVNKSATGIYLQPFMSSDFNSNKVLKNNPGSSVIYSNYLERLRHIIKEGRLFIVFNSGGLHNLSALTTIWSISKMYYGQHKPVLLFGDSWEGMLKPMTDLLGVSQKDVDMLKIVKSSDEAIAEIMKIKDSFRASNDVVVEKVVDRRVEGDERDFIVL